MVRVGKAARMTRGHIKNCVFDNVGSLLCEWQHL
jgi:hypothetical protein